MSELSLSKIQTLIDAKLLRNFADGSRAPHSKTFGLLRGKKIFVYPVGSAKHFPSGPARRKFFTKFFVPFLQFLKFIAYNVRRYATFFLRRISRRQAQKKCGEARAPQRPKGVRSGAYSGCCVQFGAIHKITSFSILERWNSESISNIS